MCSVAGHACAFVTLSHRVAQLGGLLWWEHRGVPHRPLYSQAPCWVRGSVTLALGLVWTSCPYKLGEGRGEAACPMPSCGLSMSVGPAG